MDLKLSQINTFFIIFTALLPLQLTLRLFLHLPSFLMLIYIFLICSIFFLLFIYFIHPINIKISCLQKNTIIIFAIFFFEMVISVLFNYNNILEQNIPFIYYTNKYSKFWDSPVMSSLFAGIIRPLVYFSFVFIMYFFLKKEIHLRKLCKYLIIIGFFSSLYSIYQVIAFRFGLPFSSVFSGHNGEIIEAFGVRRCEGLLYEPGPQATYLSVIFSIILFQLFGYKKTDNFFSKRTLLIMFIPITITLFLTLSPIGILTPFIAILFFIVVKWKSLSKKLHLTIISIVITLFLSLSYIGNLGNNNISIVTYLIGRISNLNSNKEIVWGDHRSVRNEIGWKIFNNHKLLGVGAGNDGFYYSKYAPYAIGNLPDKGVVINNNLKILTDSGILGFICYLIILLYPLYFYIKKQLFKFQNNIWLSNLIYSLFLSELLFVILTFNAQVEFFQPLFWITYSMLICSLSIQNYNKKNNSHLYKKVI